MWEIQTKNTEFLLKKVSKLEQHVRYLEHVLLVSGILYDSSKGQYTYESSWGKEFAIKKDPEYKEKGAF